MREETTVLHVFQHDAQQNGIDFYHRNRAKLTGAQSRAKERESVVAVVAVSDMSESRWDAFLRTTVDFSAYLAVRLTIAVIQTLPMDTGNQICKSLARLAAGPLGIRKRVTDENLAKIFPNASPDERKQLSIQMWHSLLLMVCEIAWAQRRLHLVNWRKHVRIPQSDLILGLYLSERPIVGVTGHFGNFEVGGYITGLMGFSTLTIARKLDNPFLHSWVERFRGAKGQQMVDKEGCAPLVNRHLVQGGILSLLADQHAGPKGCWVEFLGKTASSHKALALFSLSNNAPMMVGYMRRLRGEPMQFELGTTGIIDPIESASESLRTVPALTEWYNRQLAIAIGDGVEQYWWLHRRWRQPPEKVAKRLAAVKQ